MAYHRNFTFLHHHLSSPSSQQKLPDCVWVLHPFYCSSILSFKQCMACVDSSGKSIPSWSDGGSGGKQIEMISKVLSPELRRRLGWWSSDHIIFSKVMELLAPKAISIQVQWSYYLSKFCSIWCLLQPRIFTNKFLIKPGFSKINYIMVRTMSRKISLRRKAPSNDLITYPTGEVASYLILVRISHISMPCFMCNNVAETWPQYLSPVTRPQLLALGHFIVLQLTSSKLVLRGFTYMKGIGGELQLVKPI